MIVSIAFSNLYLENNYTVVCAASKGAHIIENPSIVKDNSMVSKQKVTWDCVRMGSYPQSEILSKSGLESANSETIDKSKIIADDELYSKLKKETNWKNDMVEIGGEKFKRYKVWYWDVGYIWTYFKFEPVKWRGLSTDGDKALLFSDKILDGNYYNTTQADVTWETCTMRSWLNDYSQNVNTDGIDYTETGFLNQAFSE